jgi:molybdenum cofactor sulfurtransferase
MDPPGTSMEKSEMAALDLPDNLRCMVEDTKKNPDYGYGGEVDEIRQSEYAHLGGTALTPPFLISPDVVYLDHAGATLYPTSLITAHAKDMTSSLFSNPHSHSPSSVATTHRIEAVRAKILRLFNTTPEHFDVVFVANATAGVKLILEGFCGHSKGFQYKYLADVHTSLVGVKELANRHQCLTEEKTQLWLDGASRRSWCLPPLSKSNLPGLFAYPAQSNFNGRRFPLEWVELLRNNHSTWFSLLDAASYLTTTPLNYGDPRLAPDFTIMSFYKIFGYPDLGAVLVRKDPRTKAILLGRRYFGGGTQEMMTVDDFHSTKPDVAEGLEDGTLPFHTILALDSALETFERLYGGRKRIARHASQITWLMHSMLSALHHSNGTPLCEIYSEPGHGPIISFNLKSRNTDPIGYAVFEKHASAHGFAIRTGGLCNAGGVRKYLKITNEIMKRNYANGHLCGNEMDVMDGRNLGVIRVSFGACSTVEDVLCFVRFLQEYYVDK